MAPTADVVLILGSGPNAPEANNWSRDWFDRIVVINNAWQVRSDWDDLIFPEDFPPERRPSEIGSEQRFVEADKFVFSQNHFGGFVYAGGTMAFTAGYWALHALRPKVLAFMGCDMVYPQTGPTHFYGTGSPDPLRADPTLQDLGAKSARLGLIAATEGCHCVNLSQGESELLYPRVTPGELKGISTQTCGTADVTALLASERALNYYFPSGRYWEHYDQLEASRLAALDADWRAAWKTHHQDNCAAWRVT